MSRMRPGMSGGYAAYNSRENGAASDCSCDCRSCRQDKHDDCNQDCER